ncbi:MAG TPA: hypothetical protein VKA48_06490, partial [Gammaproteobacteria bacterium]|nr:hypothetical protein [Gammaproteobacteria bacterium]
MGSSKRGLEWPKSLVVGAAMGGGFLAVQSAYAQDSDPFRMQELSSGYMLAANRFVPTGEGDKKNQEGALCASMGSANDKNI